MRNETDGTRRLQGRSPGGANAGVSQQGKKPRAGKNTVIADWETNRVFLAGMLEDRYGEVFRGLQRTLISHGIKVRLLSKVKDIWARDYCPIQIGPERLIKFRYDPDYLKDKPGLRTGDEVLQCLRGLGRCHRSGIVLDGGNIVASKTKAILTDKIYKENSALSRSELRDKLQKLLQVDQLIVIPKEPADLFGHADGMVRFIDEQSVLVNDYSKVHPDFGEKLVEGPSSAPTGKRNPPLLLRGVVKAWHLFGCRVLHQLPPNGKSPGCSDLRSEA